MMLSSDVLHFHGFKKPFILGTDASITGLGACLSEDMDGVLGYAGRGLSSTERNYTSTEQECLVVVWEIQHFRVYLQGQEFQLLVDLNMVTFLNQFTYSVKHMQGSKNVVSDTLRPRVC